ncbi:uncharacterized protein V6R79_002486 [Siganus canaliculatus]
MAINYGGKRCSARKTALNQSRPSLAKRLPPPRGARCNAHGITGNSLKSRSYKTEVKIEPSHILSPSHLQTSEISAWNDSTRHALHFPLDFDERNEKESYSLEYTHACV